MDSILDKEHFQEGIFYLKNKDPDLKKILDFSKGEIASFNRTPGFAGLINLIIEQQLSVASAKAIYKRLKKLLKNINPENVQKITDLELSEIGLSRQKISYCKVIARACMDGSMNLNKIKSMNNDEVINYLTQFKGIGDWTANCYLLACLKRVDAWPSSDLGLQVAIQRIKNLEKRPDVLTTSEIAEAWKPFRGVAAIILWSTYDI